MTDRETRKKRWLIIAIVLFVIYEIATGGGIVISKGVFKHQEKRKMSAGFDEAMAASTPNFGFRQVLWNLPLFCYINTYRDSAGISLYLYVKKTDDSEASADLNRIVAVKLTSLSIDDHSGKRTIVPVDFSFSFEKHQNTSSKSIECDKPYDHYDCIVSSKKYTFRYEGEVIYSDGETKPWYYTETFSFNRDFLIGVNWVFLLHW